MDIFFVSALIGGIFACPFTINYGPKILEWFYSRTEKTSDKFMMPFVYIFNGVLTSLFSMFILILLVKYGT